MISGLQITWNIHTRDTCTLLPLFFAHPLRSEFFYYTSTLTLPLFFAGSFHVQYLSPAPNPNSPSNTIYPGASHARLQLNCTAYACPHCIVKRTAAFLRLESELFRYWGSEARRTCDIALDKHNGFESATDSWWRIRVRVLRWLSARTIQCDIFSDLACVWKNSGSVHW